MAQSEDLISQFNSLLAFVQKNNFRVVIVEGPRGCGKTTFCHRLLTMTDLVYYKTWGGEQKWVRHEMSESLNLDLPQGTYFVLDFLAQIHTRHPVLADRGNLSALAYQRTLPWGQNRELHKYYCGLMQQCNAVMLVLEGSLETLVRRRMGRGEEDEEKLYQHSVDFVRPKVQRDIDTYADAVDRMLEAGLEEVYSIDLAEQCECRCLVPLNTQLNFLPE